MELERILAQILTGLSGASNLFLISSGLTLIFGVTRIVNFAHGSIYMLGAYFAVSLFEPMQAKFGIAAGFWLAIVGAVLLSALVGCLLEVTLLRRLYRSNELFQLLATFGVVLIMQDLVVRLWGPDDILGPRAPGLGGFVQIGAQRFPSYNLFMIFVGPAVLALVWATLRFTKWGVLLRAATEDKEMVGALGVRDGLLMTSVVCLGAALAGLAGALQMPIEPANSFMDVNIITEAFVVTVVGGMGSLPGAFIASLLIGLLHSFGVAVFPKISIVLAFLVMAVVLIWKPWGLLGRPDPEKGSTSSSVTGSVYPFSWSAVVIAGLVLCALPLFLADYQITLATEVVILALFAFSLNFIMGNGGIVSFGHAAFFGLGAYGAALVVYHLKWPMEVALVSAVIVAAIGAFISGWFVVRLAGVYAAMLTLAFAQIVWSAAFQWNAFTGGDNGINGIWPAEWAHSRIHFYYLALGLCGTAILYLWRATLSPFGYTLRGGRDSPLRCDAIGINLRAHRWGGFILAGACAGLAGGVYAFSKGTVDPGLLAIPTSVDALAMVLLGGLNYITGPLVGAVIYPVVRAYIMPLTDFWRLLLGLVIISSVLLFPEGLVGVARHIRGLLPKSQFAGHRSGSRVL